MQKKRIIIVIIAGLLLIAVIFTLINLKDIKQKGLGGFFSDLFNIKGEKRLVANIINTEDKKAISYAIYKDSIVYAGNQGILAMDFKGGLLWDETSVSFLKPYMKAVGSYLAIAEIDGGQVLLFKDGKLVWKNEFAKGVRTIDVSKDGYVAVLHNEENYSAVMTVLKPTSSDGKAGDKLFAYHIKIGKESVISATISQDSGQIVLSSLNTEDARITGSLNFINMDNGESYSTIVLENQVYPFVKYIDNETLLAVNTGSANKIKRHKTVSKDSDFSKDIWSDKNIKNIYAADVYGNYILLAGGNDEENSFGNNSEAFVFIIDSGNNDKVIKKINVSGTVEKITSGKESFAVSDSKHVTIYNFKGDKLYDYTTVSEIQKVLIADIDNYVVVTSKDIHILKAERYKEE